MAGVGTGIRRRVVVLGIAATAMQVVLALAATGTVQRLASAVLGASLATAVGVTCRSVSREAGAEARTWRRAGLAALAWAAGTATSTVLELGLHDTRRPSVADLFYLVAAGCATSAVLSFPTVPRRLARRATGILDAAVTAASLLLGSWPWILGPSWAVSRPAPAVVVGLGYPMIDVLLVTLALQAASRLPAERARSLRLVAFGVGVLAASGLANFVAAGRAVANIGGWLGLGPVVCFTLLATGARRVSRTGAAGAGTGDGRVRAAAAANGLPLQYLPPLGALAIWLATSVGVRGADELLALVLGLVVARQAFLLADNARLGRRLQSSERSYRALVQHSSDLTLLVTPTGMIHYASPSVAALLGDVAAGTPLADLVEPQDLRLLQRALLDTARHRNSHSSVTLRVRTPEGLRWLEARLAAVDEGPDLRGVVINARDVTAAQDAKQALAASERRYRRIVETAEEGIWVSDAQGTTTFLNARAAALFGVSVEEVLGRPVREVLLPLLGEEGWRGVESRLASRAAGISERYSFRIHRRDGTVIDTWVSAAPFLGEDGQYEGSLSMISDISEQKQLEQRLAVRACQDDLTGLGNRALFLDRAEAALARASEGSGQVAVLFCDLDGFKAVNDSLGHPVGDRLLTAVAQRLTLRLDGADTIARFGGDEFAVLAEGLSGPEEAVALARRLLACLVEPFRLGQRDIYISGSVGIAVAEPHRSRAVEPLLRNADLAMYEAKAEGRGRFRLFESPMHTAVLRRVSLEAELRQSWRRGDLQVHYQPIVELAGGELRGMEALLRWRHPVRGLIGPDEFIEVAEECGLLVEVGAWVLRQACEDLATFCAGTAAAPHVAVNVAASQLRDRGLPALVRSVLAETGTQPGQLVLEVTERSVLTTAETQVMLQSLRAQGIVVSLDDFGTGYSSLSHLRDFPVDVIKLDRSYVQGVPDRADLTALAESVVHLGRALGITTVAEGVENLRQSQSLARMGCALAQGYLYAPALCAGDLRAWMSSRAALRALPRPALPAEPYLASLGIVADVGPPGTGGRPGRRPVG